MSRAASITNDPSPPGLTGLTGLSGLNRQPLSPEQQLQALKRVQAQAEQRVKLGMQLFKAAEARLSTQTDMLGQIKTLQSQLREQVNKDVAKSLHEYDQWIGQIDESFTTAIKKLEEKIDAVQANVVNSEARMQNMLQRAEALLDQNRTLVEQNSLKPAGEQNPTPPPPATPQPKSPILDSLAASKLISQNPNPLKQPTPPKPTAADTGPDNEPHKFQPEQEKIYLTLLQRLMKEGEQEDTEQGSDGDTGKSITDDNDTPEDNANAA